jgi:hypothetical protein
MRKRGRGRRLTHFGRLDSVTLVADSLANTPAKKGLADRLDSLAIIIDF